MDKNRILIRLSESDRTAFGKQDFVAQSYPQKVFSSVWSLESEVNNGGFAQYFENESYETAPFIVEALDAIGALQTAAICRRATSIAFPDGMPADSEAIRMATSEFSKDVFEALENCDNEFFQRPDSLTDLLFDYVASHEGDFGPV